MLSNNTKTSTSTNNIDLSFFQRQLFYLLLFLIPWFIIPLSWDPTEQFKVVAFLFLSSLIILFEIVKWIWDGKITILRSIFDKVLLFLYGSFVLSTIFALDRWIAIWGIDGRLGVGIISMTVLFLLVFVSRGFLNKRDYIFKAVEIFLYGILVLIVLSLFSFFRVDIFNWIPVVKDFFILGLPLTYSFKEVLVVSSVLVFLSIFLIITYLREKKYQKIILPFIALILGFLSIGIFSINQGIFVPLLILLSIILTSLLLFIKLEKSLKFLPILLSILSVLVMVFAVGFQYESFRNSILGSSFEVINPIHLAPDISWSIAGKVMVNDFFRGIVGVGNESFSIAYNQFKPAVTSTISLGNISFNSASSEFFTILATRGIVGVIVWILLGVVLLKTFIADLTNNTNEEGNLLLLILEINVLLLFVLSFFVSFLFLTYFIFFVSLLILLVMRSVLANKEEQFLLKFWAVNVGGVSQDISKTMNSINWFLTGLFILIVFACLLTLGTKALSTMYIVKADIYSIEENKKFAEREEITLEEREAFFNQRMSYFYKALKYDSSNQIANRSASSTAIEIMNVLSEGYKKASEEEKASILAEISSWKNTAIDLSRESINTSSYTYSNWYTRASVYLGFLSIGLSDYSEDALLALQNAVNLNPLDFESYYRAGQIYMIKEDYDNALAAFNNGLSINGQHVPSLVLSARILNEQGDTENAVSYLEAAKKIMEVNKLEDDEMYKSIVEGLNSLKVGTEPTEPVQEEVDESIPEEFEPL